MASPIHNLSFPNGVAFSVPRKSPTRTSTTFEKAPDVPGVTALSIEFVAKPNEAHRVQTTIPAALAGALKDVAGFGGYLVMVSDQEARLVTVVTLWTGSERLKRCKENVRWIQKLLAPYLDRCLRVQTLVAHLPVPPVIRLEKNALGGGPAKQSFPATGEEICVA